MTNQFSDNPYEAPIKAELATPPRKFGGMAAMIGEWTWRIFIVLLVAFLVGFSLIMVGYSMAQR